MDNRVRFAHNVEVGWEMMKVGHFGYAGIAGRPAFCRPAWPEIS